jgi:hypothetical protein
MLRQSERNEFQKMFDEIFFHKIATGFEPLTFILQAYASTYEKKLSVSKKLSLIAGVVDIGD